MLRAKQYRLERGTLAVEVVEGRRNAITVPSGAFIRVISGPVDKSGLVSVYWGARKVEMFEVDIQARGILVLDYIAAG